MCTNSILFIYDKENINLQNIMQCTMSKDTSVTLLSEQVTAVPTCPCIFIKPLNTLNHEKTSGLLSSEIQFHDRSSSHREAMAMGPRLDTGGCLRKLWDNISCSKPLSGKSMSGSECSLLWDKSTIRRPDMDLNSSVGMLVSWFCERSNTCKQVCN